MEDQICGEDMDCAGTYIPKMMEFLARSGSCTSIWMARVSL